MLIREISGQINVFLFLYPVNLVNPVKNYWNLKWPKSLFLNKIKKKKTINRFYILYICFPDHSNIICLWPQNSVGFCKNQAKTDC